jgi:hypothetical protein
VGYRLRFDTVGFDRSLRPIRSPVASVRQDLHARIVAVRPDVLSTPALSDPTGQPNRCGWHSPAVSQTKEKAMSDGSDNGVDIYPADTSNAPGPTGGTSSKPANDASHSPSSPPSDHASDDSAHCGGIIDIGDLIGGPGSLIDLEVGHGGGQTASILDLTLGGDDIATASLLGSDILHGGDILSASLIDVEVGQGDGDTATVLDAVVGKDTSISLLGSEILGGGGDMPGLCGVLDGLLDHGCLLG